MYEGGAYHILDQMHKVNEAKILMSDAHLLHLDRLLMFVEAARTVVAIRGYAHPTSKKA